jgi:hypothetical protein
LEQLRRFKQFEKPTKTGAKPKKAEKHNELGSRGPPAPKCANACELARARDSLTVFSVLCENRNWKPNKTRAVSQSGLAIYIKKEELWKLKYFTMQKIYFVKKSSKRNQNPSRFL